MRSTYRLLPPLLFVLISVAMRWASAETIHDAVVRGDLTQVRALLRLDPQLVNVPDAAEGATPLHLAARHNRVDIARLLLDAGANPNARRNDLETPLMDAAANNSLETAQLLLADGAGVNFTSSDGNSALHWSASSGNLNLTRLLIIKGANVNLHRADGWTPLHCAAYSGNLDVLRLLLQHDADPNAEAANGDLPIHVAASNHQSAVIAVFISLGQSVDTPTRHGDTPLIIAASNGQVNVGQYLIGAGADIDHRNDAGHNALEEAVYADQTTFVVMLRRYQTALAERDERDSARKATGLKVHPGYLHWSAPYNRAKEIYKNDFATNLVGPEWTTSPLPGAQQAPLRISVTPKGQRRFLGELGSQTVQLALKNLPPHAEVSVRFALYILRAWQGNDLTIGPHVWSLGVDHGPLLFSTTFANFLTVMSPNIKMQAFPAEYPGGHRSIQTGAAEINTLGYTFAVGGQAVPMDSSYALSFTFAHTGSSLTLDFAARGLEALDHTSWGITNVRVSTALPVNPPPHSVVAVRHPRVTPRPIVRVDAPRRIARAVALHPTKRKPSALPATHRPPALLHPIERPPGL